MKTVVASIILFIAFLPSRAAADEHAREVTVNTRELTGPERDDAVQSVCVTTFFGSSTGLGIGGDGTIFAGAIIPTNNSHAYGVLGPGFALSAVYSVRIVAPECDDPGNSVEHPDAHPGPQVIARAKRTGNHQLFLNFGGGGSVLSLLDLRSGDSVAFSLAVTVPLGLRYEYVWWDRFDDVSSKRTLVFGLGALGGYGSVRSIGEEGQKATTPPASSTGTTTGAAIVGGYLSSRLVF